MVELSAGDLVWMRPDPTIGREQAGRRPALVVAGRGYLARIDTLAVVVPLTAVDRKWPNHVAVSGGELKRETWAMTEQVRAVSRERIVGLAGRADHSTLLAVRGWLADHLDLDAFRPRARSARR